MNRRLLLTVGILCLFCTPAAAQSLTDPVETEITFWTAEIHRHVSGTADQPSRAVSTWPWTRIHAVLARLFDRRVLDTTLLLRATVLYGDIALFIPREDRPTYPKMFSGRERVTLAKDGLAVGETWPDSHLRVAHEIVGRVVRSRDSSDDEKAFAAEWFVAVAAVLARAHDLAGLKDHLEEARELFPRHGEVRFLSGCLAEAIASPSVQAAVASRDPQPRASRATVLDLLRQQTLARRPNIDAAIERYRGTLDLEPAHEEARVAAYLLMLTGRGQDAVPLLETPPAGADAALRYYHLLFRARAYESTGRHGDAHASYEAASALFPSAQAPWVALSALAAKRGDFAGARAALDRIAAPDGTPVDPWWIYDECSGRNATQIYEDFARRVPRLGTGAASRHNQ